MMDYSKSQELMLAREAQYIDDLKDLEGMNADVLGAMSSLYRAGWRDCWMEEAKADIDGSTDDVQ